MKQVCIRCSAPATLVATLGDQSIAFCAEHTDADLRDSLAQGDWSVHESTERDDAVLVAAPAALPMMSVDTPIGVVEEMYDHDHLLHDNQGVPAYRRFTTDRSAVMEYRHYTHGVMTDGDTTPAWCIYGHGPGGRYLAYCARMTDGALNDTISATGAPLYAVVHLDPLGNATRIESWRAGQFIAVIDPSSLPSN